MGLLDQMRLWARNAGAEMREKVKERIVAIVRRAGEIDGNELFDIIYQNHRNRPQRSVLKAHIWQLRKLGFLIHGAQPEQRQFVYRWGKKSISQKVLSKAIKARRTKRGCVYGYPIYVEAAE